jgi:hypothetical protein
MATDRTRSLTQTLVSSHAQQFNPPVLKPELATQVRETSPGKRPVLDTYRDRRGRLYAFDGVSIRRVQG